MARCDADADCRRPEAPIDCEHIFSGYAFYVRFHPECCPRAMDGTECWRRHPGDPVEPEEEPSGAAPHSHLGAFMVAMANRAAVDLPGAYDWDVRLFMEDLGAADPYVLVGLFVRRGPLAHCVRFSQEAIEGNTGGWDQMITEAILEVTYTLGTPGFCPASA